MSDILNNYAVNVRCPHCNTALLVAVSGFGGKLSTRTKECKACGQGFFVHLLATTTAEEQIPDSAIPVLKDRVRYLQQERKRTLAELLLRHETFRRLHEEALAAAREQRDSHGLN